MNTGLVGDLSELIVLTALVRAGREVALPYGNRPGYDLLVKSSGGLWKRVQVKTAKRRTERSDRIYCDFIRGSGSMGAKRRQYSTSDLDCLIAVLSATSEFWVFASDEVCGKRCASVTAGHIGYQNLDRI